MNVAVTLRAWSIVTMHGPVPLHAPLHPVNVDPDPAIAVRVTGVPSANPAEHVKGQLIPAGELVIDPVPVPATDTVSVCVAFAPRPITKPTTNAASQSTLFRFIAVSAAGVFPYTILGLDPLSVEEKR